MTTKFTRSMLVLVSLLTLDAGCRRDTTPEPTANSDEYQAIRATLVAGSSGAAATSAGPAATGTGWATLRGAFTFDPNATPRQREPKQVTKDVEVCAPGGQPPLDEVLLVDSATRGIANVVIYVRDARRVHESAKATEAEVPFDQKECIFLTHVLAVQVGQTVELKNSDPVGHNTNINSPGMRGAGFNQTIPSGESLQFKPTAEESLPVSVVCSIHPWMQAWLLPRENGYFAVSAPDGSFEIANVPAGEELEFQVWHENAAGPGGSLEVNQDGQRWSRGRFKLKLEENEEKTLNVVVQGSAFKG